MAGSSRGAWHLVVALSAASAVAACSSEEPPRPSPRTVPAPRPAPPPPPPPPVDGVLCFRGGPLRDFAGRGQLPRGPVALAWRQPISGKGPWGGLGWTGQPLLALWSAAAGEGQPFLVGRPPAVEVITAGLDGMVRFNDLSSGQPTRRDLRVQDAPIKGTPTLDPRGLPVLYVGQGLPGADGNWHYRAVSLLDGSTLFDLPGRQRSWNGQSVHPFRGWGAFDGNALLLPDRDLLLLAGENGLLYRVTTGGRPWADWRRSGGAPPLVEPRVAAQGLIAGHSRWGGARVYDGSDGWAAGSESSVAFHDGVVYWTDNVGSLAALRLSDGVETLRVELGDDTDATPVLAEEEGNLFVYVGSEVDKQAPGRPLLTQGKARVSKVDARTGRFVWRLEIPCWTERGADPLHDLNGGVLSTVALGTGPSNGLLFFATAREPRAAGGRLWAVHRTPGPDGTPEVAWSRPLKGFSWSSPATDGATVVVGDSAGWLSAFDAASGQPLWQLPLGGAVESSPVFWGQDVVVGVRGGSVVAVRAAPVPAATPSGAPTREAAPSPAGGSRPPG